MTTITLSQEKTHLSKTNFKNLLDLYDFIVENQIVTEIGNLSEDELSKNSQEKLLKSKSSSKLINI